MTPNERGASPRRRMIQKTRRIPCRLCAFLFKRPEYLHDGGAALPKRRLVMVVQSRGREYRSPFPRGSYSCSIRYMPGQAIALRHRDYQVIWRAIDPLGLAWCRQAGDDVEASQEALRRRVPTLTPGSNRVVGNVGAALGRQ